MIWAFDKSGENSAKNNATNLHKETPARALSWHRPVTKSSNARRNIKDVIWVTNDSLAGETDGLKLQRSSATLTTPRRLEQTIWSSRHFPNYHSPTDGFVASVSTHSGRNTSLL